jgi:lipopolysaccharide/colanic/teichoic acid biosynthesis glycosyltransferase
MDLIGSAVLIGVVAVPGLVIAAAIALTSPGPLFYREERIGRNGVPFRIWKFRTMYCSSDQVRQMGCLLNSKTALSWRMYKSRHDPRITKVGRFLRQWSLDELPQLFNILLGEMSLVGPRPIVDEEKAEYAERLRFYLMATPGLSGLWQVSGRSNIDYAERARLDATYVRRWNLLVDLRILLRTIPAVVGKVGAW